MAARNDSQRKPLVSIVTPVFNAEPYLAECIESVLAQTYENWEYTIVNNCSTDSSREIAAGYAVRDQRIRLVDNGKFLQQLENMNRALSLISPESVYCKMVLADDWLFPSCVEEMVRLAERHPTVGIVSSYRLDDRRVTCDGLPYPSNFVRGRDICRMQLLSNVFVVGSPNTILLRSDVVRGRAPFYSTGSLHADTEACYEILMDHDLGFVHQVLSFTRRQNESLTGARKRYDPWHLLDKLVVTRKYGPQFLDTTEYRRCRSQIENAYYRFLVGSSLKGADAAFWEYHRNGLRGAGRPADRWMLPWSRMVAAFSRAANPLHFARHARDILRRVGERRRGEGTR